MAAVAAIFGALASTGCGDRPREADADAQGHSAPTAATRAANAQVGESLDLADRQDFEDARRGLVAADPDLRIPGPGGEAAWDMPGYAFLDGAAPDSVNPSLWRQAQLNNIHGLFKVTDGVYQLRGFDLANMTIVEGRSGWIVVDPLTARETASRAIAFARRHLGDKPVVAIVFTHSHVDHFGGVLGVVDAQQARSKKVRVIAPEGFMEEATSENVLAGGTMMRRSMYMYGMRLARSPRGHVDTGLGKGPAYGSVGVLEPTEIVGRTRQELDVDGVRFVFQNAPGSEAPAELTFYLPERKAFCGAEVVSHTLHNLYTLRGAKVRDALKWSGYIDEIARLFGDAEVYFGSHHWPIWGNARIVSFLETQRDTYKYIHDQTVRLALHGYTPREIAERLELPASLRNTFSSRDYYGTVRHNAKAVYQFYFGWYDGNPANLDPLPPEDSARKYVALIGGAQAVLQHAQEAFDRAEYRWAAELLNHLVFAEPGNENARALLARTYDQLGYRAESGPWRDVYLTGAFELRHGGPKQGLKLSEALDLLRQTPMPRFLDAMAVRLDGAAAEGKDYTVNLVLTDLGETYVLRVRNAVLHHAQGAADPKANATLRLTHELYLKMLTGAAGIKDTLMSDDLEVQGSRLDLIRFFSLFEKPDGTFNIVTP
ncbi:MAG: MBL fold metallo-hydrolase [Gammaproteobacteria bacterium]|nr:MBL fold metallo-hydrolase [Gammaproteobacteria bacterium]